MATPLDLQEQEQLDALKAFWKQYGNLITAGLVLVALVFAGVNGWRWWQRDQAARAGGIYEQLDQAARAGDAQRAGAIFADLRDRYPRTVYAQQGALLAARVQFERGQADAARASLSWAAEHAIEDEYRTVARLRLAALQLQAKDTEGALKTLEGATAPAFAALVADRRGDVLLAQGKADDARAAYRQAWAAMDDKVEYRQLVDAKLTALGAPPGAASAAAGAAPEAAK